MNNSVPGGERERWKQRFPTVSMCKVEIVCCRQCDGYGMADEFVDANFCSDKCRKLGQARLSLVKSLGNAAKVAAAGNNNKRKSIGASSELVVESALAVADAPPASERSDRSAISDAKVQFQFVNKLTNEQNVRFLTLPYLTQSNLT